MAGTSKTIGLLHHMGGGNLGDDGTFAAVMQNIKSRWPTAAIVGLTMNPEDTQKRHGIPAYPIRQRTWSQGASSGSGSGSDTTSFKQKVKKALRKYPVIFDFFSAINFLVFTLPGYLFRELVMFAKAFRVVRTLDMLIVCGGGQLVESSGGPWHFVGGPFQFPFTIFKWIFLARLTNARCVILNVGAGPLVTFLGKHFIRRALAMADYASFRDPDSQTLIKQIGVERPTHLICDSAYSLNLTSLDSGLNAKKQNRKTVGFAPMAYGDPRLSPKHDPSIYNDFIRRLAAFAAWLLQNGYDVTLFCTDIGIDPPTIVDIENILETQYGFSSKDDHGPLRRVHQWTAKELLLNMSSMDYAVVCRFHAVVFAHILNIPVLAINHHAKVKSQMADLGLAEYCVEMDDCGLPALIKTFNSLVTKREEVRNQMVERLSDYRGKLSEQFDQLFPCGARRNNSDVAELLTS